MTTKRILAAAAVVLLAAGTGQAQKKPASPATPSAPEKIETFQLVEKAQAGTKRPAGAPAPTSGATPNFEVQPGPGKKIYPNTFRMCMKYTSAQTSASVAQTLVVGTKTLLGNREILDAEGKTTHSVQEGEPEDDKANAQLCIILKRFQ